jgi:tRNA(Ile)-lysidine synthase
MDTKSLDRAAARRRAEGRLLAKVEATIQKHGLLHPGAKVLIAYSGGVDSTALLTILLRLREKYSLRLALAHFNHLLRRTAAQDEEFAVEQAQRHGLPLYLGREDIRAYAEERGLNLEEAARERRYEFLRTRAVKTAANRIATGHTMTDQAETVILRLLRGAGPAGLAGISPSVDGLIIRPLLEVERRELEAYLKGQGIAWREDETNRDRRFLRNRVRLELIPLLERDFEPTVVRRLGRLADICREEEELLEGLEKNEGAERRGEGSGGGGVSLNSDELGRLPVAAGRRRVRDFLRRAKGDLRRISFTDVEAVRRLGEHKELNLPGGLKIERDRGRIRAGEKRDQRAPVSFHYSWDGLGELAVPELGLTFRAETMAVADAGGLSHDDERIACLDAAKVRFPVIVRRRRDGDRYRPIGAPGRKKLKEIMRARGVPLEERARRPVFLSGGKIVWVLGLPVGEDFKVTSATARVLVIRKA